MTINVFGGGNTGGPAFPVQRSVRLRSSASAYFNRTFSSSGTDLKKWTLSFWIKRGTLGVQSVPFSSQDTPGTGAASLYFLFSTSNTFAVFYPNTATTLSAATTAVFRDTSAWYHFVITYDSTQATNTDRIKIYVNGVQQALSSPVYPSLNATTSWNSNCAHFISKNPVSAADYLDGYITEINSIDGQALTPSSFGSINSTTGVWQPIKYSGTYGTNGFYLNFNDNSAATAAAIGKDSSGNGNNWTPNNISVTAGVTYDSMLDVPTLTSATNANFPVLNVVAGLGNGTYSDGNLAYLNGVAATWKSGVGSMGATSGKYYFEYTVTAVSSSNYFMIGAAGSTYNGFASYLGRTSDSWSFQWNGASSVKTNNDVTTTVSTAGSISVNDVLQVAIDLGTGSIWWGRNNTWVQGDPAAGTSASYTNLTGTILPGFAVYSNGGDKIAANFGQRPFAYTPPSGFKSLNTYNLPAPTIPNGATQFAVSLWSGNNSTQSITNTVNGKSFQPDLVWLKQRSPTGTGHILEDSVRGALQYLGSESTAAESTIAGTVTAFNSNGFSIGSQAGTNATGSTYVGWQWKAGGTAVTNTSGSITSSVSANPSAGFSIVTYTGTGANATVGHGLGVAPKMVIVKNRSTSTDWGVWQTALAGTEYLILNNTNAKGTGATIWNSTVPTSSVISVGTNIAINASGNNHVAYCFSEIAGHSKFGSYTGNGSTDGPFVYLGFRPRWLLLKLSSNIDAWLVIDSSRQTYNVMGPYLSPNSSAAEATTSFIDFTANGFKIRGTGSSYNTSSGTIIYAAFAESPFNYSLAR